MVPQRIGVLGVPVVGESKWRQSCNHHRSGDVREDVQAKQRPVRGTPGSGRFDVENHVGQADEGRNTDRASVLADLAGDVRVAPRDPDPGVRPRLNEEQPDEEDPQADQAQRDHDGVIHGLLRSPPRDAPERPDGCSGGSARATQPEHPARKGAVTGARVNPSASGALQRPELEAVSTGHAGRRSRVRRRDGR